MGSIKATGLKTMKCAVDIERSAQGDDAILWIFDDEQDKTLSAWLTKDELRQLIDQATEVYGQL